MQYDLLVTVSKEHSDNFEPRTTSPARILIVDDQKLIRFRVREILRGLENISVIGEAADGRAAVSMALSLKPDIIIMDVSMPEQNGIDATRQILAQEPEIRVLAHSGDSDESTVRRMFAAGACGYINKTGDAADLVSALVKVLAGERYLNIQPNFGAVWVRRD
jgi:DNA-binding NarL/FixJ family response regulator